MSKKDIGTLKHEANFSTQIGSNMFWVPVNELGGSRYTNDEIEVIALLSPEEKKAQIATLYEAMQLFIVSKFKEKLDVKNIEENGLSWEHHKPGYYAVKSNNGCCASTSSWLTYILKGKYEEIGLLCFSRPDGSGHVLNYIMNAGWYYIIDLMPFTAQYLSLNCMETGNKKDFVKSKYITGACIKTRNLQNYSKHFNRMLRYGGFTFVFYQQRSDFAYPVHVEDRGRYKLICYPKGADIICLSDNDSKIQTTFLHGPYNIPNWNER